MNFYKKEIALANSKRAHTNEFLLKDLAKYLNHLNLQEKLHQDNIWNNWVMSLK